MSGIRIPVGERIFFSSAEVKNESKCIPSSPVCPDGAVRDNVTRTLPFSITLHLSLSPTLYSPQHLRPIFERIVSSMHSDFHCRLLLLDWNRPDCEAPNYAVFTILLSPSVS